ncbi:MAG: hypothetical protein AAF654_14920 [Myxococcota bacterium]
MDELRRTARRAYERGRFFQALRNATLSLVVVGFALILKAPTSLTLALGAIAVAVHVLAAYAHDHARIGLWVGLGLGAGQVVATGFMSFVGMRLFPENCESLCFALVFLLSAGIGFAAARPLALASAVERQRSVFSAIALGVPLMALGCLPGAIGMLSGSIAGLATGMLPGWLLVRRPEAY